MEQEQQSPPLIRPIPRRPFDINLTGPTPPSEDSDSSTPAAPSPLPTPQLLNPRVTDSGTVSRSQSSLNLNSSALFGIYSPLSPNKDPFRDEADVDDTPWGAGAQTPVRRPDLDDETYELLRERSRALGNRQARPAEPAPSHARIAWSLGTRTGLLFLLGMSYGTLVTRLRGGGHSLSFSTEGANVVEEGGEEALGWGIQWDPYSAFNGRIRRDERLRRI